MILITPGLRISSDGLCYSLEASRVAEKGASKGTTVWEALGHYPTLEQAAISALRRQLVPAGVQYDGVRDLILAVRNAEQAVIAAISAG